MGFLFFLQSRILDKIYFFDAIHHLYTPIYTFYFYFYYIQDMYKNYLIFLLLFPQILYSLSIYVFYIYFIIASRGKNYYYWYHKEIWSWCYAQILSQKLP